MSQTSFREHGNEIYTRTGWGVCLLPRGAMYFYLRDTGNTHTHTHTVNKRVTMRPSDRACEISD